MYEDLQIIVYPDPRLRSPAREVEKFDERLPALARRMLQLMREHHGVGLAGPQVAQDLRIFVINPDGEEGHDRIYINPMLMDLEGGEEDEEGCLSIPGVHAQVWRAKKARIRAMDVNGQTFEETETGFVARIWQHEFDHLNGTLIVDRMGPTDKLSNRKTLRELETSFSSTKK